MSEPDNFPPQPSTAPVSAKRASPGARRAAVFRLKMLDQGRKQYAFWLTPVDNDRVKALLAGKLAAGVDKLAAERDTLASHLENSRSVIRQQQDQLSDMRDDLRDATETIKELRIRLDNAERAQKEKPAKTFKVPELSNRRAQIVSAMSLEEAWQGEPREFSVTKLKQQADLAKKFATEIRQARSRLVSLVQITSGEKMLEQSKTNPSWGGWKMFRAPLLSPAEKALLEEASVVIGRVETDVERAGSDLDKLHKKREAEDKARRHAASAALDAALFSRLDRRGEILFIAAVNGNRGWAGPGWDYLLDGVKGKGSSWKSAAESFREALQDAKGTAIDLVASGMKDSGKSTAELAKEIADKYHHPDTREKWGDLADKITAYLVSEQFSKNQ